jgi:hypothetical protein
MRNQFMSDRLKPMSDALGPLFTDLERRVQANVDLTAKVRAALSGPEKDHVISASYRDDTLVILADSAAWCPQIRYAQRELLDKLRKAGETQVSKLKVKVGRPAG